ncbi:MAG: transcriptional regulator, partial [Terracidiphilus sp.]
MFQAFFVLFLSLTAMELGAQTPWSAVGPDGGDARSFAAVPDHPNHLYLGTTNSWIYESMDGGSSWHRLSKVGAAGDMVVDHIVVDSADPAVVYAAAWASDHSGGGLWISHDGGRIWAEAESLHGQSIRALVQAPSNPKMLFTGTLRGVFRSSDAGETWSQISPPGSHEIHEIESLAIDPTDPDVVYAGTWHLPWKTTDGGKNWHNIKRGVIDDSDVFSILIDPDKPRIVYASACSGIYKSKNAGELFRKIQGIPATARRTRVLRQDPTNLAVVYAGTTEGLYKTVDAGRKFNRMTGPDVIVNDVYVNPKNPSRVLLATDRSGVLLSTDGAATFAPANEGFSERKVEALLVDHADPSLIYAGVLNDKAYGSVF